METKKAKSLFQKLPNITAQKAEYTKCARLCFYAEPGVMPRYLTYDEIKYVKYLSAFGYKVIIGDWSCNIGLGVKPTKEMLGGGDALLCAKLQQ